MFPWSVTATDDMPSSRDPPAELRESVGAVEEGVLAVEMKVDEVAGHVDFDVTARGIGFETSMNAPALALALVHVPRDPLRPPRRSEPTPSGRRPPISFRAFHAACDGRAGQDFGACFVEQMAKAGAPPAAIAFARRVDDQGYLTGFRGNGTRRPGLRRVSVPRQREPALLPGQRHAPAARRRRSLPAGPGGPGGQPGLLRALPGRTRTSRSSRAAAPALAAPPPAGCAAAGRDSWFRTRCATAATPARSWARLKLRFDFDVEGRFVGIAVDRVRRSS